MDKKNTNLKSAIKAPLLYLLFIFVSVLISLILIYFGVEGGKAALFAVLIQPAIPVFHTCLEMGYCHVGGALSWWEKGPLTSAISMHFVFAAILYIISFIILKIKNGAIK